MARETLGNRHPNTLISISNLGKLLRAKGDLAAAEPLLREALDGRRTTLGNGHPVTLASIVTLYMLLIHRRLESTFTYIATARAALHPSPV